MEAAGRRISAMSLGTAQLGMNYGIANREGKPDRAKSFEVLSTALSAGINALDTARAYGDSEEVLGDFFKANPETKEKVFITTKLSSGLPAGSSALDVEKAMVQSLEISLDTLGVQKVNCLMLHNAADMSIHGKVVAHTLRRFVAGGHADMVGVSVYHPKEANLLMEDDVYQAVQLPANVFDQRFISSGILDRLHKRGILVFVRSVFFQGLFFLDPQDIRDPGLVQSALPHLLTLRRLCEKAGMSIARFAVAFLMDMPGITSLVMGVENPEQVLQNISLFDTQALSEDLRYLVENSFENLDYGAIMAVLSRPKG